MTAPFTITKEEYLAENIHTIYPDDQLETYINQACYFILTYAQTESTINWNLKFEKDDINSRQLLAFKHAAIAQLIYWEANGGQMHYMSGYSSSTNSFIPNEVLKTKEIAPLAKAILQSNGILYKGLRG